MIREVGCILHKKKDVANYGAVNHFYLVLNNRGIIALESTVEELAHTVHPHPTLSEVVMEAAHAALGQAIHI